MAMPEKADVSLFYNDEDKERAMEILDACKTINLRVISYDDMTPGGSKLMDRLSHMKNSWCNVLVVTENFAKNPMNVGFETENAVWKRIAEDLPKVVPVKCCNDNLYPEILETTTEINGSLKPNEIAEKVRESVRNIKQQCAKVVPVEIEVKEYRLRGLKILDIAVEALDKHINIDDKMKKFHEAMKQNIGEVDSSDGQQDEPTGCSCRQGELWKREIQEKKYWAIDPPEPFRNIKKIRDDQSKHSADIHQLYADKGYLKLAGVFLFKQHTVPSECNNIREYLDGTESECNNIGEYSDEAGILQLLERCNAFGIRDDDKVKIQKVRKEVRNKLSHLPKLPPQERQKMVDDIAEVVTNSLYGILPPSEWERLKGKIQQIQNGTLKVTIQPGREMELVQHQDQEAETNLQTMQQNLEGLQVGSQQGPGVSHQQAGGATASPTTDN